MEGNKKALQMVRAAPAITKEELDAINAIYPAYIFRRRKTREIWTTCCGRHETIPKQEYSDSVAAVMDAEHQREEREYGHYGCHCGYMSAPPKREPEPVECPYCGKLAKVKELGRTGNRDNLAAYCNVVVLRWYRNALWAVACSTKKLYSGELGLTARPVHLVEKVYRFKPGEAVQAYREYRAYYGGAWSGIEKMSGPLKKLPIPISEPRFFNADQGYSYDVIGSEEIDKSPFRWCGFREYERTHCSLMKFLALCTIYPRQVEMLMKAGLSEAVSDLINKNKKNAAAFCWEKENPLEGFGLSKTEIKEFMAGKKDLDCLAKYKQFHRAGVACSLAELDKLHHDLNATMFQRVTAKLKRYKLPIGKWRNYIDGEKDKGKKNHNAFTSAAEWWNDYVDAAEVLGLNLKNLVFLTPKELKKKHDEATVAATTILAARRSEEDRIRAESLYSKYDERYGYSAGRWLIRPPLNADEIVAEGKCLKHCVGKYADDYLKGRATLLFMRDAQAPQAPLVTIEMRGNSLVQIHGWDDERTRCKANPKRMPPRKLYAEFLEPWLAWVAAGSRRDKKGRPIVPTNKKKKEAILA